MTPTVAKAHSGGSPSSQQAAKGSKSASQIEKERKAREHRERILKQHGSAKNIAKPAGKADKAGVTGSAFQKKFEERAQGFQVEFRFRNAPPRPPVGPIFVGKKLDVLLQEHAQQYKTMNSIEVSHRWELHTENELGVPLAASAMDIESYQKTSDKTKLHPDDEALLDWKGSLGDTAAEELKIRQDRARAAARAALTGRAMPTKQITAAAAAAAAAAKTKKKHSRVLDEQMQTWMKKTTYLSNDYSRKVHDFKSLAKTKQELAEELEQKRAEISKKRSAAAIEQSFEHTSLAHPSNKKLKVKRTYPLVPNIQAWGKACTHIIIDKPPAITSPYTVKDLHKGIVANVDKKPDDQSKMYCDVFVPAKETEESSQYEAIQSYDLDVVPLMDSDGPQMNFCIWIDRDRGIAKYLPLPSRVQLSTGRPLREKVFRGVERRSLTAEEISEEEKEKARLNDELADADMMAEETAAPPAANDAKPAAEPEQVNNEDGEDEVGDDDDDDDDSEDGTF